MLRSTDFTRFIESLHGYKLTPDSPRAYDEDLSSSSSSFDMDLEEISDKPNATIRRVVTNFDDELDLYAYQVPKTSSFAESKPDATYESYFGRPSAVVLNDLDTTKRITPRFSDLTDVELPDKASEPEICVTPRNPPSQDNQLTASPYSFVESQAFHVSQFPESKDEAFHVRQLPENKDEALHVSQFPESKDEALFEVSSVKHEEIREPATQRRTTFKRTYLESQTLDGLVTSVNIAGESAEPSRKRKMYDFTDKSYASLFGTVTNPVSGEQSCDQQIFPKSHWPVGQTSSSVSDHMLTSMSNCDVRLVSIKAQSSCEMVTKTQQMFATVLSSAKDACEVTINGQTNCVTQCDSFKVPAYSRLMIHNTSTRLRARVQLVAING
jgi:hypothetical protein